MPTAVITGASSGIGRSMALILSKKGYDLVLAARSKAELEKTAHMAKTHCTIVPIDLSVRENCFKLYEATRNMDVEILINNAGFGVFGEFTSSSLESQLNMLDLNAGAVHTLTYLYLKDMCKKDRGHILNVASLAAFAPGPLLSGYYAGKAYVYNLSLAAAHELKHNGSSVKISVLCPGPVNTNFNERAGVNFSIKPISSKYCAAKGIAGMFKGRTVIIPGLFNKITAAAMRLLPQKLVMDACYAVQKRKKTKQ